jgi:5'-methylthioadenosine phosphorylase
VQLEQIIEYLHRNAVMAQSIVRDVAGRVPAEPDCSCHSALKNAILTDRKVWPARTRARLKLLLAKYG